MNSDKGSYFVIPILGDDGKRRYVMDFAQFNGPQAIYPTTEDLSMAKPFNTYADAIDFLRGGHWDGKAEVTDVTEIDA